MALGNPVGGCALAERPIADAVEAKKLRSNPGPKGDGKGQPGCSAKKRHMALVYRRRAQRILEARKAAPTRAALQRALKVGLPSEEQAAAERALFDVHPHLRVERDAPWAKSLATLNAIIPRAWAWFTQLGFLAKATASGRVKWNPGLAELVRLERLRLEFLRAGLLTPEARFEAGLPILPEDQATDIVAEARALARAQDEKFRKVREQRRQRTEDGNA